VKTTGIGGEERGFDPAKKKVKGRKRHLSLWTHGGWCSKREGSRGQRLRPRDGIKPLMELVEERFPRLSHPWLDALATTARVRARTGFGKVLGLTVEVVRPPSRWVWVPEGQEPPPWPGITVLPRRWVVERTFSWIDQNRRLSKDY
jgi:transposase